MICCALYFKKKNLRLFLLVKMKMSFNLPLMHEEWNELRVKLANIISRIILADRLQKNDTFFRSSVSFNFLPTVSHLNDRGNARFRIAT